VEHATFIKDLCIMAEQQKPIQKDEWGIRGVLELWFQEIEVNSITLHIRRNIQLANRDISKTYKSFSVIWTILITLRVRAIKESVLASSANIAPK
jgi:hypothetical protein